MGELLIAHEKSISGAETLIVPGLMGSEVDLSESFTWASIKAFIFHLHKIKIYAWIVVFKMVSFLCHHFQLNQSFILYI